MSASSEETRFPWLSLGVVADVVGLILAVVTVAALLIVLGAGGAGAALARSEPTAPPLVDLRFSPQPDPVPYCHSYPGTGTVPDGYQLLIFDRGATGRDRDNITIFPENPANQWLLRDLPGRTADSLPLVRAAGPGDCTPA